MKALIIFVVLSMTFASASAESVEEMAQAFFKASEALDREYTKGKQDCQRRYLLKNAPERDSAKYQQCLVDFDNRFQKKRCDFYLAWYKRSKAVGGMVRPENYPQCTKYKY
ncbi:MAG: hypothetical protein HKN49_14805 [Gammaproteobacteria bacterium]|nr:hypothetical protein [Gammaproteobacteria bacterium]